MELTNKTVVLTGASGGIGRALALQLARDNATLVLVGRNQEQLDRVKTELPAGSHAWVVSADIATDEGRHRIAALCTQIGSIDALINCAGVNDFALFHQQKAAMIAQLINVNVTAPILLTQRLLPLLQKANRSLIVNIGSTFGTIGHPGFVAYCASKFAMRGFSQALRRELADTSIRVQYIAPRATKTEINTDAVNAMNAALKVAMDDPADVAAQIVAAIKSGRQSEVYLGWPEKLFARINQLLPSIVDGALLKQLKTIRGFAATRERKVSAVPMTSQRKAS